MAGTVLNYPTADHPDRILHISMSSSKYAKLTGVLDNLLLVYYIYNLYSSFIIPYHFEISTYIPKSGMLDFLPRPNQHLLFSSPPGTHQHMQSTTRTDLIK